MMRLVTFCLSTGLAVLPVCLWSSPFDGVYRQTANADCGLIGVDGGSLKIEGEIFYGVEMQCFMTNPVEIDGMQAMLYQMECSGRGQVWTERMMLMEDAVDDAIYMIWDGYAFRYPRCTPPVTD